MTNPLVVLATDGVSSQGLAPLSDDPRFEVVKVEDSTSSDFLPALASANGLIVRSATKVGPAMLEAAPGLAVIGRAGVGVDNIDVDAASARGIAVINAPGGNTVAATELTMALILALVRKLTYADASVRAGRWDRAAFKGVELNGRLLGLIGAGRIGSELAARCRAFGMDAVAFDPYLSGPQTVSGIRLTDLDEVLATADVISCHVPLTDETRGMLGRDAFARMKDSVFVINASRGGVVDEAALVEALESGTIAGAALDVFEREPLDSDSPLLQAPNLVLTPHLGASTAEAQLRVAVEVAEAVRRALLDGDITGAVNETQIAR